MIRRETKASDGDVRWILIDQREHARVAGQLAGPWQLGPLATPWQTTLRWTATHHDDGWVEWDKAPPLDAEGRPISFVEMELAKANRIWSDSIEIARQHSPWSAYLVARHFLELRASGSSANDPDAMEFHRHFDPLADRWLAEGVVGQDVPPEIVRQAEMAVEWLQLFDWLSLLLCCGPLEQPTPLPVPGVTETLLSAHDPWHLQLAPWPFQDSELHVEAQARQVPARRYASTEALCQTATPLEMHWRLTPGESIRATATGNQRSVDEQD